MKYRIPLLILTALAIAAAGFTIGAKTNDQRLLESMTTVANSLGHEVTEEEMLKLVVEMTYLVNETDVS